MISSGDQAGCAVHIPVGPAATPVVKRSSWSLLFGAAEQVFPVFSRVLTKEKASCFIDPLRQDAMRDVTGDNDL